jgi:UDP-N-acetyl-D-mannosaminuronic acid dehydrogenase
MKFDVCIIGLGYVGLTLATALASRGLRVLGVEKRQDIVDMVNRGEPHFQERGLRTVLKKAADQGAVVATRKIPKDTVIDKQFIITVGTPLRPSGEINLDYIVEATSDILDFVTDESLVVLRSTVKVGTCRDIVIPLLEKTGKKVHVAMCPERTLEGKALEELFRLPQVIGSDCKVAIEKAQELFSILTNSIVKMSSYEAAEITKLVDNTFRDMQFGFANEVARVCETYGVNAMEVIQGGSLGYERTNVALPGLVGGPCLEKDPHIFCASAAEKGLTLEITAAARTVNERQPRETVDFIKQEATNRGFPAPMKISLLGMAFKGKPETDDLRGAMSIAVLDQLKSVFPEATICLFDPVIAPSVLEETFPGTEVAASLSDALEGAHMAIIANNHPHLSQLTPRLMLDTMRADGFIYDYWNHFSYGSLKSHHQNYYAVGNI